MIEFLRRFFGAVPASASMAKERLRLVLMTDHLALDPEIVEAMKRDLVDVISRHVEVDLERIEVTFEQQDRAVALLANIPILSVRRPPPPSQTPPVRPRRKRKRRPPGATAAEPATAT
ncbi:MAG: cell division topological specificity factor MinE [Candidatus Tyrphobacter sp.]